MGDLQWGNCMIEQCFMTKTNASKIGMMKAVSLKNRNEYFLSASSLALAMGLTGCGGGGSSTPATALSNNTNNNQVTSSTNNQSNTFPPVTTGSNELTLAPSGSSYISTSVNGFTQKNSSAYYQVADASNDEYGIIFSAVGSGLLTFEFDDASDVVTFETGSDIQGFTDLKIINGTIDATSTEIGSIINVSVASSVKLTAQQVVSLEAIVISAETGSVDVEVTTKEDLDLLTSAIANGNLKLFSPADDLLKVTPAENASVSQEEISSSKETINAEKRSVSEAVELGIVEASSDEVTETSTTIAVPVVFGSIPSTPSVSTGSNTTSASSPKVEISIADVENGLTSSERINPISINVTPDDGENIVSVKVNGSLANNVAGNLFQLDGNSLLGGSNTVEVISSDAAGNETTTQGEFWVIGSSTAGSDMFDLRTSVSGDVVTVEAYVKNIHPDLSDGLKTIDFIIDVDSSNLDYIEGSFTGNSDALDVPPVENGIRGDILASIVFRGPWENYDEAVFEFQAAKVTNAAEASLTFLELTSWDTNFSGFTSEISIS